MKSNVYFNVITTIIGLLLFHTATSETGYPLIGNPIEEPILLSVFGIDYCYSVGKISVEVNPRHQYF